MFDETLEQNQTALGAKIDAAISAGIRQGLAEKSRRRSRIRRRIGGLAAACVLLFSCMFTIQVSPVFAAMVREIPGLEKFVDLIEHFGDTGVQLAVDHDFLQPVGVSDEKDGMKFTVQGIIADESRMVVFYEVKLPGTDEYVEITPHTLTDEKGNSVPASIGFKYPEEAKQDIRKNGVQRGTIDFSLGERKVMPDHVILKVRLKKVPLPDPDKLSPPARRVTDPEVPQTADQDQGPEFAVTFPIDKTRFHEHRQEFALNRTLVVEGQKITFSKAILTPLRLYLHLEFAGDNRKHIFGAGDIRLVDDKGTVWRNTSSFGGDSPVYHFESPYFTEPKSLSLEGSWFRALDKDKMEITIDTEKRKILRAPDDRVSFFRLEDFNRYQKIDLEVRSDPEDNMLYDILGREFTDADGQTHQAYDPEGPTSMGYQSGDEPPHSVFYLSKTAYKQPLTFKIWNYPAYIRQPYRIKIK